MTTTQTLTSAVTLGRRDTRIVFAGLLVSMFLGAVDQTIMATALPTIAGDLGGLDELTWVVTVYVLAAAATTPMWGKLSDQYGRRELLRAAIAIFLAGSVLSGLAQSIGQLIAFRTLQGAGAGGVMTGAMAAVGDLVSPRERGRYQGYIQSVFVLASIGGPLLGGTLVDHASWRWVFYVNVPVGAVALILLAGQPHGPASRAAGRLDLLGNLLLAASVVCGLLVTVWGGARFSWRSPQIAGLAVAAAVLAGAFVWQERGAAEPVLPLRLFRDRVFVVVTIGAFLATLSLFAPIVFLPLFLQVVTGATATASGVLLLPLLLASTASTVAAGRIMTRTGRYKIFPVLGFGLMSCGLALLATLGASSGRLVAMAFMTVFGFGFGMVTQVLVVALHNAVDRREIGTATAGVNLFRALGGSLGVAIYGAVFAAGLRHGLPRQLPGGAPVRIDAPGLLASPQRIRTLAAPVRDAIAQSVADSVHTVFLVAAPIAVVGFVAVLLLREMPLQDAGRQFDRARRPERRD